MPSKATKLPDSMETLPSGAVIQHGPYNERIYLMKPGANVPESLPRDLIALAERHGYTKVFVKVPSACAEPFVRAGYGTEASIPRLYRGADDGIFMAYYLSESRASESRAATLDYILRLALRTSGNAVKPLDVKRLVLRRCGEADADNMAALYRAVFPTYPFPIHDPAYLRETMGSHIVYYGVACDGELIALSSAETDADALNVEMTDFATLPLWRGNSLGTHLLCRMENEMRVRGMKTAYTIARAASPGMNVTFAKCGYAYGGRLKNNTNISGAIESMNVWYKGIG